MSKIISIFSESEEEKNRDEIQNNLIDKGSQIEVAFDDEKDKIPSKKFSLKEIYVFNENFITNYVYDGSNAEVKNFNVPNTVLLSDSKIRKFNNDLEQLKISKNKNDEIVTSYTDAIKSVDKKIKNIFDENKPLQGRRRTFFKEENMSEYSNPRKSNIIINEIERNSREYDAINRGEINKDIEQVKSLRFEKIEFRHADDIVKLLKSSVKKTARDKIKKRIDILMKSNKEADIDSWVRIGINTIKNLHREPIECPLCGSNISNTVGSIIDEYDNYFNDESIKVKQELKSISAEIYSIKNGLNDRKYKYKSGVEYCEKYKYYIQDYNIKPYEDVNILIQSIDKDCEDILSKIKSKMEDLYTVVDVKLDTIINSINIYNTAVNNLNFTLDSFIKEKSNNQDSDLLLKNIRNFFIELGCAYIKEDYPSLNFAEHEKFISEEKKLQADIDKCQNNIDERKQKIKFEAMFINEYLKKLNVHNFTVDLSNGLQIVYKNKFKKGLKHTLSEGEKTTLSFAYFLSKIRAEIGGNADNYRDKYQKYTFIIDDPISSLDNNRLFYTAQLIATEFENANQIFVSSHSLRFLKILINYKLGNKDRKWQCYHIKKNELGSELVNLEDSLSNYNTSYFYKFKQILDYLDVNNKEVTYETVKYYLPNNIRVVLETFFSFKFYIITDGKVGHTPGIDYVSKKISEEDVEYIKTLSPVNDINSNTWKETLDKILLRASDVFSHGSPQNVDDEYMSITEDELTSLCKQTVDIIKFFDKFHVDKISGKNI